MRNLLQSSLRCFRVHSLAHRHERHELILGYMEESWNIEFPQHILLRQQRKTFQRHPSNILLGFSLNPGQQVFKVEVKICVSLYRVCSLHYVRPRLFTGHALQSLGMLANTPNKPFGIFIATVCKSFGPFNLLPATQIQLIVQIVVDIRREEEQGVRTGFAVNLDFIERE